jgi:hypothetical protein
MSYFVYSCGTCRERGGDITIYAQYSAESLFSLPFHAVMDKIIMMKGGEYFVIQ